MQDIYIELNSDLADAYHKIAIKYNDALTEYTMFQNSLSQLHEHSSQDQHNFFETGKHFESIFESSNSKTSGIFIELRDQDIKKLDELAKNHDRQTIFIVKSIILIIIETIEELEKEKLKSKVSEQDHIMREFKAITANFDTPNNGNKRNKGLGK